tara:strand:+ start:3012 stop:3224 length:213 start_codon:yes stop_codon:yes gene_type:complete
MSYLTHLKRNKMHHSTRWIVKYNDKDLIKEVKLIYSPEEYRENKRLRTLNTQNGLIKILENDKIKRNGII